MSNLGQTYDDYAGVKSNHKNADGRDSYSYPLVLQKITLTKAENWIISKNKQTINLFDTQNMSQQIMKLQLNEGFCYPFRI